MVSPQNMAWNMVQYLHSLDPEDLPLILASQFVELFFGFTEAMLDAKGLVPSTEEVLNPFSGDKKGETLNFWPFF